MPLFTLPEDLLIAAVTAKQPRVRLEHCIGPFDMVLKKAFRKERRLLAFLSNYEVNYIKTGIVQLSYDYDVVLHYQEEHPDSLDDVLIDAGSWDATSVLTKGKPKDIIMITENPEAIFEKLNDITGQLTCNYEGILGWESHSLAFEKLSKDVLLKIGYSYIVSLPELRQYQSKAALAAKAAWRRILGKAKVPDFVKPFLAFSYLTQTCHYEQRAFDEVESNPKAIPSDPIPHLAYGPLVENRGICSGLSWAFKTMMDEAGIECICITGFLKEDIKTGHAWDLVKLDGQFYHVDPTWGIKEEGVPISALLQPDMMIKSTHIWDTNKFPPAKGVRFDYDYIEDFLAENGTDFIDAGANEEVFFPDEIIE